MGRHVHMTLSVGSSLVTNGGPSSTRSPTNSINATTLQAAVGVFHVFSTAAPIGNSVVQETMQPSQIEFTLRTEPNRSRCTFAASICTTSTRLRIRTDEAHSPTSGTPSIDPVSGIKSWQRLVFG